jgi:hypothetical protein
MLPRRIALGKVVAEESECHIFAPGEPRKTPGASSRFNEPGTGSSA